MKRNKIKQKLREEAEKNEAIKEGEDPCWDGYTMVGTKKGDNGEDVPDCVPEEDADNYQKESVEDEMADPEITDKESDWYLAVKYGMGRFLVKQKGDEIVMVNQKTYEHVDTVPVEKAREGYELKIVGKASTGEIKNIEKNNSDIA